MERNKVLVTDAVHPLLLDGLAQAGYQCTYQPKIDWQTALNQVQDYDGIVINSKILVNRQFLDQASRLRFVARLGSGLEIVDLEYAAQKGVRVFNSPNGNCTAVAEHAMAMLLSLAIQLRKSDQQVRKMIWKREENRGWELMGKTVGIIGFGHTGAAFAQRLSGFGVRILAYDKYKSHYNTACPYVEQVDMQTIFEQTDILSLHLPLTPETTGLADDAFFDNFKKNIVLINTSRGAVIPTQSLIRALDTGKVRAAGLDVFENEKPETFSAEEMQQYTRLLDRPNILCSPHVAGWTVESKRRLAQILLDKILRHFPLS